MDKKINVSMKEEAHSLAKKVQNEERLATISDAIIKALEYYIENKGK